MAITIDRIDVRPIKFGPDQRTAGRCGAVAACLGRATLRVAMFEGDFSRRMFIACAEHGEQWREATR